LTKAIRAAAETVKPGCKEFVPPDYYNVIAERFFASRAQYQQPKFAVMDLIMIVTE
jgi:hypothetical protein